MFPDIKTIYVGMLCISGLYSDLIWQINLVSLKGFKKDYIPKKTKVQLFQQPTPGVGHRIVQALKGDVRI